MEDMVIANEMNKNNLRQALLKNHTFILFIIMACVMIIGSIFVPSLMQKDNLLNVLRLASIVGLAAIGSTVVLLVGEIDLSIGSIMSLSLVTGGLMVGYGSVPALTVTCLTGIILGIVNGVFVTKLKINSLMVTLGTMSVFGGLANVATRGQSIFLYDSPLYLWLGRGYIGGIPVPVIIFLSVGIILSLLLRFTKTGKEIYFTGANKRAAWISGININKIKITAYAVSGLTAALAGPLLSSQTNRITPIQGVGFELSAIAVAVLGGTSLSGGKGTVIGTILGALTFQLLLNILTLSGVGTYMEQVLKGFLLIVIVVVYQVVDKPRG
ncbi:MAG: ribose ABC transporter permease [Firmicutes bacterium HGW-Firmicutes-14]|nr:MAG: ribose ABC transporter permease [Firmicutes bacterium HGW-Firmicutes-14]